MSYVLGKAEHHLSMSWSTYWWPRQICAVPHDNRRGSGQYLGHLTSRLRRGEETSAVTIDNGHVVEFLNHNYHAVSYSIHILD